MDLHPTPEDRAFRLETRRWLEANVPRAELKTPGERLAWHQQLYEAGYIGMGWPKEYGGLSASPMRQAIVADELARINAPPAMNGLGISICGPTIVVCGTEAQKRRYLKKILTAEELWRHLSSAPNAGSDLASLRTRPRTAATASRSTARRSGRAAASTPTGGSCSPAPTPRCRSTRASPASSCRCASRASRCGRSASSPGAPTS